jgi:hypothetical protein
MKTRWNQAGSLNVLLIPVILLVLLFIGAGAFGYWAFTGRQDYKNNVDKKISAAVAANKSVVQATDAKTYAEAAKQPLRTYSGPEAYGSLHISYPKTWSAYISTFSAGQPVDGYFYPDVVPSIVDPNSSFALRVQVLPQAYSQVVGQFSGPLKQGKVTITPYTLPKVASVVGVRVDGQISNTKQGSMVILPMRDKTLKIWTEASAFTADFNNNVLPNTSFSP